MAKEATVAKSSERGKSLEEINEQAVNLLGRTNDRARYARITRTMNRYMNNITSSEEYRNASKGVARGYMNGNAAEVYRNNEILSRLNEQRIPRSRYMR